MADRTMPHKVVSANIKLTDNHLKSIGRVSVNWSLLEFYLGKAIGEMLGPDPKIGRIVTTRLTAANMMEIFRHLATFKDHEGKLSDELNTILAAIRAAQSQRRLIIHGVWAADDDGSPLVLGYYGKDDQRVLADAVKMSVEDIENIAASVSTVTESFITWWGSARSVLVP